MSGSLKFGCKSCGYPNVREKNKKLYCMACGSVFSLDSETAAERDARVLYIERLEKAEGFINLSPPRFDDAEDSYRDLIKHYPECSDGYWGLACARYGIKYEIDSTGNQKPTCYKSGYEDFRRDADFQRALRFAESEALRRDYTQSAELITKICNEWRKEAKKHTYDVFISFKASDDATGRPTADAAEMHELYTYLLEENYKVFFSPVTMKKFSGLNQEPYVYNALQNSKVIIVYGSNPEYFSTTWVQSEWSRFLRMTENNEKVKGSCIVAYDGFNPSELPRALRDQFLIDASRDNRSFYADIFKEIQRIIKESGSEQVALNKSSVYGVIEQYKNDSKNSQKKEFAKARRSAVKEATRKIISEKLKESKEERRAKRKEKIEMMGKQAYINSVIFNVLLMLIALSLLFILIDLKIFAYISLVIGCMALLLGAIRKKRIQKYNTAYKPAFVEKTLKIVVIALIVVGLYRIFCYFGTTDMVIKNGVLVECYVNEEVVTVPDGVTSIRGNAFAGNLGLRGKKIKRIVLPESIESIGAFAFAKCKSLEVVQIGSEVTEIGKLIFNKCDNMETVIYNGTPDQWNKIKIDYGGSPSLFDNTEKLDYVIINYEKMYSLDYYFSIQNNVDGGAEANYYLGLYYDKGYGVEKNSEKAWDYYSTSASKGYNKAEVVMGCHYLEEKNYDLAMDWFNSAAQKGNADALYYLGSIYENGLGVVRDIEMADEYYKKAADKGHREAEKKIKKLFDISGIFNSNN